MASVILSRTCRRSRIFSPYTKFLTYPHKKEVHRGKLWASGWPEDWPSPPNPGVVVLRQATDVLEFLTQDCLMRSKFSADGPGRPEDFCFAALPVSLNCFNQRIRALSSGAFSPGCNLRHGLRHELPSPAQTLGSWVLILLEAWMSVLCAFILYLCCLVCM
jgi:hypothetical protein